MFNRNKKEEEFQSTLSIQRVTIAQMMGKDVLIISIHTLHTESDGLNATIRLKPNISIHTLHTESDALKPQEQQQEITFQSTLSIQRVTKMGS